VERLSGAEYGGSDLRRTPVPRRGRKMNVSDSSENAAMYGVVNHKAIYVTRIAW
jgi:hypothetical protein